MRNYYIISYDIRNSKRRGKVAKTMVDYGDRLQFSVFGCQLDWRELGELKNKLRKFINHENDQILFIDLGPITDKEPIPEIDYIGKCWIPEAKEPII